MDHAAFVRANTSILSPPLVPEIKLHLAHEALPIWQKTEDELGEIGLPPPFWAFAWAGGQALARHILDTPSAVSGKRVVEIASGSGMVGIAAMKAGAKSIIAADIDLFSVAAIEVNLLLNNKKATLRYREGGNLCFSLNAVPRLRRENEFEITSENLLIADPPDTDLILVGDLFYEKNVAERCLAWLELAQAKGIDVLIGDPGRSYLPKDHLVKLAEYSVPVSRDLEDADIKRTAVWRLA
jgi:predicted nicotinamide N-methyase